MKFAERGMAAVTGRRGERLLALATVLGLGVSAVLSLVLAPPDAEQGQVQRLMYVHVPAAWLAYLAFGVVFVASVAYLKSGKTRWDRLGVASAEVGVLFTSLTIVLGALWGKPVWGTWWTWDPRLTTTAVLLLIYLGYLALRQMADNPARRARWSAVVGVVGFVDVPIVHMSVTWWRSLHQAPTVLRPGAPTIAGSMLAALLVGVVAFTILYAYLIALRLRVGRLEDRVASQALSARISQRTRGAVPPAPASDGPVAPPAGAVAPGPATNGKVPPLAVPGRSGADG
jgi:heme exporter protein C